MKVRMKDGSTKTMHVTTCTGYAARQLSLDSADVIRLAKIEDPDLLQTTVKQLAERIIRAGNLNPETNAENGYRLRKCAYGIELWVARYGKNYYAKVLRGRDKNRVTVGSTVNRPVQSMKALYLDFLATVTPDVAAVLVRAQFQELTSEAYVKAARDVTACIARHYVPMLEGVDC